MSSKIRRKTGTQSFPRQSFVDAVFGLGHSRLFSRRQSPQCRPGQKRQFSSRGMNRGTPTRPLALRDDLVTPIVVCVCCCHRRASQKVPVFCRKPRKCNAVHVRPRKKVEPLGLKLPGNHWLRAEPLSGSPNFKIWTGSGRKSPWPESNSLWCSTRLAERSNITASTQCPTTRKPKR